MIIEGDTIQLLGSITLHPDAGGIAFKNVLGATYFFDWPQHATHFMGQIVELSPTEVSALFRLKNGEFVHVASMARA